MNAQVEVYSQDIDVGFIRLYILYRAGVEPISSRGVSEMLGRRGLTLSIRFISRILCGLESKGYLDAAEVGHSPQRKTLYCATSQGRLAIKNARCRLRALFEVLDHPAGAAACGGL